MAEKVKSRSLEEFKADVAAKARERGCTSLQEWLEKFPGEHLVAVYADLPNCALCGLVEPRGGFKKLCKGPVSLTLR